MHGPGGYLCLVKLSQREKDKYCVFTYMWNVENKTNESHKVEIESHIVQRTTSGERGKRKGKDRVWA